MSGLNSNFLKTTLRNLSKETGNTFLSITGLIIALCSSICIFQYNKFETSFDDHHAHKERIFRLVDDFKNSSSTSTRAGVFYAVANTLKNELPEIELAVSALPTTGMFRNEDRVFDEPLILFTSPNFFEIFNVTVPYGSYKELDEMNTVILSETLAKKCFNKVDPIGELIDLDAASLGEKVSVKVIGVFKDLPPNTHLKANAFVSMKNLESSVRAGNVFGPNLTLETVAWRWIGFYTYIRVVVGTDVNLLSTKITTLCDRYRKDLNQQLNQEHKIYPQAIKDIHTTTGFSNEPTATVNSQLIYIFYVIAALILAMAWINYINLATARAVNRAKEVGIRKLLGAERKHLIFQFLGEATILNLIALVMAVALLSLSYEFIQDVLDKPIFFSLKENLNILAMVGTISIFGAFISGVYPAFIVTNFQPLTVLKGKFKHSSKGLLLKRVLVGFQFFIAIGLLGSLVIIENQLRYMMDASLGVSIDNRATINMPAASTPTYASTAKTIKDELNKIVGVTQSTISSMVPGIQNQLRSTTQILNKPEHGSLFVHLSTVDYDFLQLFDLNLIAGRNFVDEIRENEVIINRKAMIDFGYTNVNEILDEKLVLPGNQEYKVIGVIENFNQIGLQFAYEPIALLKDTLYSGGFLTTKLNTLNTSEAISKIEAEFRSRFPEFPFAFNFLDETFKQQYQDDKRFQQIFMFFSSIAILIACLGLISLSTFVVAQKSKEASIRKVVGASELQIFILLNKEYILMALTAFVIAAPIIYYLLSEWLTLYQNRISIGAWMLVLPLFPIISIVIAVTFRQTYKTATANPAKTLKED